MPQVFDPTPMFPLMPFEIYGAYRKNADDPTHVDCFVYMGNMHVDMEQVHGLEVEWVKFQEALLKLGAKLPGGKPQKLTPK